MLPCWPPWRRTSLSARASPDLSSLGRCGGQCQGSRWSDVNAAQEMSLLHVLGREEYDSLPVQELRRDSDLQGSLLAATVCVSVTPAPGNAALWHHLTSVSAPSLRSPLITDLCNHHQAQSAPKSPVMAPDRRVSIP